MAGYRGDGFGIHGDHGDDDFYEDMRGRDENPRDREREGRSGRDFMFDRGRDRDEDRFRAHDDNDDRMDRAGDRVRSWLGHDDADRSRFSRERGGNERRDEGFLQRGGYQESSWKLDEDRHGIGRRSHAPMGLRDPDRSGGGLGMDEGPRQFSSNGPHDHYLNWRDRQLAELDRDYDDYCRENERKFSSEFENWRQERRKQSPENMAGKSSASGSSQASSPDAGTSMAGTRQQREIGEPSGESPAGTSPSSALRPTRRKG